MVLKLIKKYLFVILAIVIAAGGYLFVCAVGSEYTFVYKDIPDPSSATDIRIDHDSIGRAEILGSEVKDNALLVHVRSQAPGRCYLSFECGDITSIGVFYVHGNGVITRDKFFGDCTGMPVINLCILLYIVAIFGCFIAKYRASVRKSLYSYDNVLYLGLIIFSLFLIITQIEALTYKNGISGAFYQAISSTQSFVILTFPVVIVTTVLVTVSNITLMRKEGRTWRNLLAVILGLTLGIGALLPFVIGTFMQTTNLIDVHFERGAGRFIEMFLENIVSSVVTYLECILLGTIITGIRAAKHIPKFDKDYIIIHGCQIRKDGTLTKLLQSRADRAIEFAKMQKEANGKDIIFVPSGGKGSDEIISEGEAIKRYLIETGISEDKILAETESVSTEENFKFAKKIIEDHFGSDGYKAAFSTTNYHVFRSGMLAEQQGLKGAEGIGSKTKRYFWINAFVREFIATIYAEKKTHVKVVLILLLINIISVLMLYLSEAVLF